jgi:hypothetical protein
MSFQEHRRPQTTATAGDECPGGLVTPLVETMSAES